jgi:hypothetical protein
MRLTASTQPNIVLGGTTCSSTTTADLSITASAVMSSLKSTSSSLARKGTPHNCIVPVTKAEEPPVAFTKLVDAVTDESVQQLRLDTVLRLASQLRSLQSLFINIRKRITGIDMQDGVPGRRQELCQRRCAEWDQLTKVGNSPASCDAGD